MNDRIEVRIKQSAAEMHQIGPTLDVWVGPPNGALVRVKALIDTGASRSAIGTSLASTLGLERKGTGEISEAGRSTIVVPFHHVHLAIDGKEFLLDIAALASIGSAHQFLIGRDVLSTCMLHMDFENGLTLLSFKPTD